MRPVFYQGAYGQAVTYEPEKLPSLLRHPIQKWRAVCAAVASDMERERLKDWRYNQELKNDARRAARKLLRNWMTPEQRITWETRGWFDVTGSLGNGYRIHQSWTGNVQEKGRRGRRWCGYPRGLPDEDMYLAQALAIMSDEKAFKKIANPMPY